MPNKINGYWLYRQSNRNLSESDSATNWSRLSEEEKQKWKDSAKNQHPESVKRKAPEADMTVEEAMARTQAIQDREQNKLALENHLEIACEGGFVPDVLDNGLTAQAKMMIKQALDRDYAGQRARSIETIRNMPRNDVLDLTIGVLFCFPAYDDKVSWFGDDWFPAEIGLITFQIKDNLKITNKPYQVFPDVSCFPYQL